MGAQTFSLDQKFNVTNLDALNATLHSELTVLYIDFNLINSHA